MICLSFDAQINLAYSVKEKTYQTFTIKSVPSGI